MNRSQDELAQKILTEAAESEAESEKDINPNQLHATTRSKLAQLVGVPSSECPKWVSSMTRAIDAFWKENDDAVFKYLKGNANVGNKHALIEWIEIIRKKWPERNLSSFIEENGQWSLKPASKASTPKDSTPKDSTEAASEAKDSSAEAVSDFKSYLEEFMRGIKDQKRRDFITSSPTKTVLSSSPLHEAVCGYIKSHWRPEERSPLKDELKAVIDSVCGGLGVSFYWGGRNGLSPTLYDSYAQRSETIDKNNPFNPEVANSKSFFTYDINEIFDIIESIAEIVLSARSRLNIAHIISVEVARLQKSTIEVVSDNGKDKALFKAI